ncbi:MgtC/SapB family protein [Clostridium sporogenes]|uniref:MgtC/SapB family protein n=1 Tax=Clostridium botulinum TaxID=1491 RepID=A0A6M0T0Y4_CLOBO|nr:MgtC/SapB family protein [Clostridium sporogenes]NFA60620.1 MgtC/SapB family protein [Clostridium botulinum]NFI74210.1 MgtC/SapB family protein [Clostridium sporogenes]NFL72284.1 MgtC/SapB family protein [Clostridium sporogenes]NFM25360.1 MgtC/SapB family protein [Clostridium sporogenes]NFP62084.1 MgtC/SapB family protein [Clostridium sporogenes]
MDRKQVIFRIFLSIVIGGVIGVERERKNRPAGFRTHILVCIGSCMAVMIQLYIIEYMKEMIRINGEFKYLLSADISRMASQVITGVGFLGAGTIIRDKGSVKGLTTAASIWVVACIGISVGLGFYFLSLVGFLGLILSLIVFENIESSMIDKTKEYNISIEYLPKNNVIEYVIGELLKNQITIKSIKIFDKGINENQIIKIKLTVSTNNRLSFLSVIQNLQSNKNIHDINILKINRMKNRTL